MNNQLHKRLEEAARESFEERYPEGLDLYKNAQIDGFIAGAEYGYKEAITQAKEWLKENVPIIHTEEGDWVRINIGHKNIPLSIYLADFEEDMNKLWEEQK